MDAGPRCAREMHGPEVPMNPAVKATNPAPQPIAAQPAGTRLWRFSNPGPCLLALVYVDLSGVGRPILEGTISDRRSQADGVRCRVPQSPDVVLTARLDRIQELVQDLARANGSDTPGTRAIADAITREVEAVRHALTRRKPV
jgi:hypothetical protein